MKNHATPRPAGFLVRCDGVRLPTAVPAPAAGPAAHNPGPTPAARQALIILTAFIVLQLVCQIALLVPALNKLRVVWRSAPFLTSFAALMLVAGRGRHPSAVFGLLSLGIVGLQFLNPSMNSMLAALADIGMYVAILGPVFWTSRLAVTPAVLRRVAFLLWVFNTASAAVGVLQVHYPGRFQPAVSEIVANSTFGTDSLKIVLANGQQTLRPMGLTDNPGGAAASGLGAVLFGLGFFLSSRSLIVRGAAGASVVAGLFCIYLCQVRSILVICLISAVTIAYLLVRRGEARRVTALAIFAPVAVVGSFVWAIAIGGDSTFRRVQSLTEGSAGQVYYKNRGVFLESTVRDLVPQFPFGAGLGRWGMVYTYFGNKAAPPGRQSFYVEIQYTGWLLDGGVPLILTYSLAILTALWAAYRVCVRLPRGSPLAVWAAVVVAYDFGAVAVTFNSPLFMSQGGMEFWLLNAALMAAARNGGMGAGLSPRGPTSVAAPSRRAAASAATPGARFAEADRTTGEPDA